MSLKHALRAVTLKGWLSLASAFALCVGLAWLLLCFS